MQISTGNNLRTRICAAVMSAGFIASSCEGGSGGTDDAAESDTDWRDAAPNPGQVTQDVAMLRAQPFVLDPAVAVGTLPGVVDVGARGNATWTVPIDAAPGVAGMTPELSINYSSDRGNGPLGMGFALGGISSIRRCQRTIIDDGAADSIGWTNDDALCLGGDRLVLEIGSYGLDGAHYRLANDPSVRIVQHAPISTVSSYFEAFHAGGHIVVYGTAAATQWRGPNTGFAQPYVWGLSQRRDRFSNTIDYSYDFPTALPTGPGEMRLRTIRYGGTGAANTRRELTLDYAARPDELDTWWFGARQRVTTRLTRITARGPAGAVVRSYRLAYATAGDAERSQLTSLRMCSAASVCMPPTTFEWGEPPDEDWGSSPVDYNGDIQFGLDLEAIAEVLVSMRGAMVTDMDGDLQHELLLHRDGTGTTPTMLWRPRLVGFSYDLALPPPPALPSYLDAEIGNGLGLPVAAEIARVQPPMTAAVVNADGNRLSDILTPRTPFGNAVDLDADGYLYAQGFWISYGQSTPLDYAFDQVIDVINNDVPDPSGERTYSMVVIDHDADLATDAWLCRGDSALDSRWVLMRAESDGMGAAVPFTFHPTDIACSVHDELAVAPLATGAQRLLVIPAYDEDGEPIDDAERNSYSRLELDLATEASSVLPSVLPRDRYQRWHDRQCRNGIAYDLVDLPVYGAGLGLDRQVDVNGDGLVDVLRFELAAGDGVAAQAAIVDDLRPDLTGVNPLEWAAPHVCDDDVAIHRDAVIRLWQNTGEAYIDGGVVHEFQGIAHANLWLNFAGSQVMDVTDDGLMDLVLPSSGENGGWTLLASRGDGTFAARNTNLPDGWPAYSSDAGWEAAFELAERVRTFTVAPDLERPGILFVGFIEDGGPEWVTVANIYAPGAPNDGEHVVGIVDGLGRQTTFDYKTVDASNQFALSGPRVPLPGAPWVTNRMCVEARTEGYGQEGPNDCTSFEYSGGVLDRRGRGMLGFEEVRAKGEQVPRVSWTRYSTDYDVAIDDYPAAGRPLERIEVTYVAPINTAEIQRTEWAWKRVPTALIGGETALTHASETRVRNYAHAATPGDFWDSDELDGLTPHAERVHTEERDALGTVLESVDEAELGERVEMRASGVTHDTAQWLLGQVERVEVESCPYYGDCKTRTTDFTYAVSTSAVNTVVTHPGDPELKLTTTVQREGHGNVWHSSTVGAVGQPRVTITDWDAEGVHPLRVTNPIGHVSHVVHDVASGAVRAMVEPGGITKIYRYDGFYRQTRKDRLATPLGASDGAPTTTTYLAGAQAGWPQVPGVAMRIDIAQTAGQRVVTHFNRVGQPVLQVWRGALAVPAVIPPTIGSGVEVYQRTRYDIHGEVNERSVPQWVLSLPDGTVQEPAGWERFERDALARPVRSIAADGSVLAQTTYAHFAQDAGLAASTRVTTTDINGHDSRAEFDGDGRLVRSVDANGITVCFVHAAFGDVASAQRNCAFGAIGPQPVAEYSYDDAGRLRSQVDSGWGTKTFDYTPFGELINSVDGNGDATTYALDGLGRVTSRTDDDGVAMFVWDAERPGMPSSETSSDGVVTTRTYDGFARPRFEHTVVPSNSGPDDYVFEYVWGPGEQLLELAYPAVDGEPTFRVRMQYDATGRMRAVSNTAGNALLWAWRSADPSDHVLTESRFGGANTVRQWHPTRGSPLRIDTSSAATNLQQLEYSWRSDGELNWREDEQHNQREQFTYDTGRRLTGAQVYQGALARKNQLVTYDALGNIRTKSDAIGAGNSATYSYDGDGKVTLIGTASVFHDGQGNVLSQGPRSLTYSALDKVRTAVSGATSLAFTYDALGNRARRTSGPAQTISVGSLFERELQGAASSSLTYHVMAGGVPVARIERIKNGGAWTTNTYAIHGDALGSTGVLSNSAGGVYRRLSHDVWGAARRATDWSIFATESDTSAVGLGFTGHRARLDVSLIDMRGRMYDPRIARFTSADPVLTDASDPQAWNRYSYVGNRPLVFTDPSGWARDPYINNQVVGDPGGFGVDGACIEGGDLMVQITIVYSDGVSPGVGWRDTAAGFWGLGPDQESGVHARNVGNGWVRVELKGIGTRYMHVTGYSLAEDEVRDYREKYNARLYPAKRNEVLENLVALGRRFDDAAVIGLAIADFTPHGAAVNLGIDIADTIVAAANGEVDAGDVIGVAVSIGANALPGPSPTPRVGVKTGRGKNHLGSDASAVGDHSTFKVDASGRVTGYGEWTRNARNPSGFDLVKRFDLRGKSHINKATGEPVPTPHVQGRGVPGGVRPAYPEEIPK